MSAHAYTEEQLVEQPAIQLFKELGWSTVSALEEIFGSAEPSPVPSGHPLPVGEGRGEGRVALLRETKGEVVLVSRLRAALERLNPALPPEAITAAVDELTRDRSAIYGAGKGGTTPVRDKKRLLEDLKRAVDEATVFCANQGVVLPAIEQLPAGSLQRLERIADAVDALISPDPIRQDFLGHERIVKTLYDAVLPDPAATGFAPRVSCLRAIADAIRAKINPGPVDISGVMGQINTLLDASIEGVTMSTRPAAVMDLSKIDFAALARRFQEAKRKNLELEALKTAIRALLERLIRLNRTRVDFQEKFEELIEAYNTGSQNIEELFRALLELSRSLTQEQTRHVRENLTEEELTILDILTRPGPELTPAEREEVKRVARHLLERLKTILTFNWRQTTQARARVRMEIEDALDTGLPRAYAPEIYRAKCGAVFEHLYENYQGDGVSVFAAAG